MRFFSQKRTQGVVALDFLPLALQKITLTQHSISGSLLPSLDPYLPPLSLRQTSDMPKRYMKYMFSVRADAPSS